MPNFPSVTAAGAFESPAVQAAIKTLATDALDTRVKTLEADTGWRTLTSWTTTGTVTGDPLPAGIAPTSGTAGSVQIRRRGPWLSFAVRGATVTGAAPFNIATVGWALRGFYQSVENGGARIRFAYNRIEVSPIAGSVVLDAIYGSVGTVITTTEAFPTVMVGTPA